MCVDDRSRFFCFAAHKECCGVKIELAAEDAVITHGPGG